MICIPANLPSKFIAGLGIKKQLNHIGFIYKSDNDKIFICHLCWHFTLKKTVLGPDEDSYVCSTLNLDDINQKFLAASFSAITETNHSAVPYGIKPPLKSFDDKNKYIGNEGEGLTCATFILAVFEQNGFPILEKSSWAIREDDKEWQRMILDKLRENTEVTSKYIEAAREFVGKAARFRPEEVFVCGVQPPNKMPTKYSDALKLAKDLKVQIENLSKK